MELIFPYFIIIAYMMPLYRAIYSIVDEKVTTTTINTFIYIEFND
jgi:hypothetical protein